MSTKPDLPSSVLVSHQIKKYGPKIYKEGGEKFRIVATVRYDDQCKNGHNSFSITATIDQASGGLWRDYSGGCCHEEVAKRFPELAHLIKWHLTSSEGPMHYVANTVYHAEEHGPQYAWIYYTGPADPLGFEASGERLLSYAKAEEAKKAEGKPGYRVQWDEKTSKVRNLAFARSSAVWPDATDAELTQDRATLEAALIARLPALMAEFKTAVESLGFTY